MNTPHIYYAKSETEQKHFMWRLGGFVFLLFVLFLIIAFFGKLYFLPFLAIPILLSVVAPFIDTPALKRKGKLVYYSPLFIAEKERNSKIVIHGGTLFDYYFVIDTNMSGTERTRFILLKYIQGLIRLISAYEDSNDRDLVVTGTSYLFNEKTAKNIGFKMVKTDFTQTLILVFNYIPLTISHSYSKAKISFPNLSKIRTYEGKMIDLIAKKQELITLEQKLLGTLPVGSYL